MGLVMAVAFTRRGRLYYLDPGRHRPRVGEKVLVPTADGPEVAECVWPPEWVEEDIGGLPVCAGLAGEDDLERDGANRRRRAEVLVVTRRLVRAHALPMKVVAVDVLPEQVTVYYSAPHRVDFRALLRQLGAELGVRLVLRQLGARDEARVQGGIGPCGRELCCSTFLPDFEPVSVRMAKDQDLARNPLRIAGACGRLMCCLAYEQPLYAEFRQAAPAMGAEVTTPEGAGRVVGYDVPRGQVMVRLRETGRRRGCTLADVCPTRQARRAREGRWTGHLGAGEPTDRGQR